MDIDNPVFHPRECKIIETDTAQHMKSSIPLLNVLLASMEKKNQLMHKAIRYVKSKKESEVELNTIKL